MLQNKRISGWLELVKNNSDNLMQILAEKALNPNNYYLSKEAKKRLRWLYMLYHKEKGNISKTARKIGISRQWLSHLKQVFEKNNKDPRYLEPESRAPNNTSNRERIPKETEDLILKVRDESLNAWGKEKIARALKRDYKIKINPNTVNKYLHKHKRIDPKISLRNSRVFKDKKERDKEDIMLKVKFRPPKAIKDLAPGALVEKDMKYVRKQKQSFHGKNKENFWYQFSEIDSFTRIKKIEIEENPDTAASIRSHKESVKRFPFKIACENTDNGFENNNDFSKELKKENTFHFYSNAGTPTDNPRVERSHLTDEYEFYKRGNTFSSIEKQKEAARKWENIYNFKRPHQALGYLTPMEFYELWKKDKDKARAIVEKWQEYLKRQRIRLARSRRIKKGEQINALMRFIDAKLNQEKEEIDRAKLQLINCKLCSVA